MPAISSATSMLQHQNPPGLPGYPLLGVLPRFRRDPLGLLLHAFETHGDVVHMRFGPSNAYLINHPDNICHVLQTNNRNYHRDTYGNQMLQIVTGLNLLTSDGDYWLRQRRMMQPAFHRQRIAAFADLMVAAARRALDSWAPYADRRQPLDISAEMMRLTLEVVGQALFSVDLSAEASALGQSFTELLGYLNYRLNHLFSWPLWAPTPRHRRMRRALATVDQVLSAMIAARRESGEDHGDLMSMLLQARDQDSGTGMTDEQLKDEMRILIGAGHETTANALTWTFSLLAGHPNVEAQLHAEVQTVLGGRPPGVHDLPDLPSTRMVIEEAMRLYPPAWVLSGRMAIEDDQIGGYTIPAGGIVFISPYVAHRDPRFWPEPARFDPRRFAPQRAGDRPRCAYLPFGGGPRLCIGNTFALTEAQLILASVAQRYRLRLLPGYRVEPDPIFTLRVRGGLPMMVEPLAAA